MKNIYKKTIHVSEAAYFMNMSQNRLRNLIKRGRYDFGQMDPPLEPDSEYGRCHISAGKFFAETAITWDDIFELRKQRLADKGKKVI